MNKILAALHPIRILGVFAHPGERANSLYLLLSGTAQVIREGVDGTQQVLAHLKPGAFFGEEGLVSRQTHHAHVIAEQNVTCLVLSPEAPTTFPRRGIPCASHAGRF